MDKLRMQTLDGVQDNIDKIAALFPGCITEKIDEQGKLVHAIDFDKLRQELSSEIVEGREERYQFTWPDKKKAILLANSPINATLRPCREESVDFDNTQNLYIEGDNLDVLKCLKETYLGKVKMIYIDPPYNTGNDFVYEDDFAESTSEYLANSGQYDEQGNRLVTNTESNGRFHTDWLNMIYPRLKVARDLLTEDGVIFVSIDDNEVENLRTICDEIFGESNFIANHVWQKKYGPANDAMGISFTHEYILVYGKDAKKYLPELLTRNTEQLKAFKNPDNDPRGIWRASDLSARTYSASCDYPIIGPTGEVFNPPASRSWAVNKQTYETLLKDNRITFGINGTGRPMFKKFLSEVKEGITPETWLSRDKVGDNKTARYELKDLFPENIFDTPKPSSLIYYFVKIANTKNAIILDFFSGSATTAHSIMQLNAEDGGERKFIMIQLPEQTDEKSVAYKAGYHNICEIGKERIRRVGKKIKEEKIIKESLEKLDIGFRVLKLNSSNMEDIYYSPVEYSQQTLFAKTESIKSDRTSEDLLFQVMLELGATLDSKIEQIEIEGKTIYNVATNYLVACFDNEIDDSVVTAIAKMQPQYAVFRDSSMADDSTATNFEQIFKTYSPNTVTKVL